MYFQSNNSALDPFIALQQRIKEIRAKNVAISQKLKFKTRDYNVKHNKKLDKKRKEIFFDKNEALAVERCHTKALKMCELFLKLKKKCGFKLKTVNDLYQLNNQDFSIGACVTRCSQPIISERKQKYKSKNPLLFSEKFSTNFVEKQHYSEQQTTESTTDKNSCKNDTEIITILDEGDIVPFCQSHETRCNIGRKQKTQSKSGVKEATSPNIGVEKFMPLVASENHAFNSLANASSRRLNKQYVNKDGKHNLHEKMKHGKELCQKIRCMEQTPKNRGSNNSKTALNAHEFIAKNYQNLESDDQDVVYLESNNSSFVSSNKRVSLHNTSVDNVSSALDSKHQRLGLEVKIFGEKRKNDFKANQNNWVNFSQELAEIDQNLDIVCLEVNKPEPKGDKSLEKSQYEPINNGGEIAKNFIKDFAKTAESAIEKIIPMLDLTEEPVDFPIPILHRNESITIPEEKLKALKSEGVKIKYGRFSDEENDILRRNFKDFQTQYGIYNTSLLLGIGRRLPFNKHGFSKMKKFLQAKHLFVKLGKDINQRSLKNIYYRARLLC